MKRSFSFSPPHASEASGGEGSVTNTAISVCADNAGNFYIYAQRGGMFAEVQKFTTASCLGQPPGTVLATTTLPVGRARKVRFGGGKVWLTNGSSGIGAADEISRIDPVTLTVEASGPVTLANSGTMSALYAFGSLWVSARDSSVYRIDPTTLANIATVLYSGAEILDEMSIGPAPDGTPDTRIFVTMPNAPFVGVVDPGTETWVTALDPSGLADNAFDGMGIVSGYLWAASFQYLSTSVPDFWYVLPSGGVYTTGRLQQDLGLYYGPSPSFTAGGDLTGTNTSQTVSALRGIAVPSPATAVDGYAMTVSNPVYSTQPRRIAVDPTDGTLWVSDSGSTYIHQVDPVAGTVLNRYHITDGVGLIECRDIAVDDTYVYVTTWDYQHVLVLYKWGAVAGRCYCQGRALFVALDGAGSLYVTVGQGTGGVYGLQKFDIATSIGQPINGYTYEAVYNPPNAVRQVVSGGGFMWVATAWHGGGEVYKVNPATMLLDTASGTLGNPLDMVYGLGGLWVANQTNTLQLDTTTLAVLNTVPSIGFNNATGICIGPDLAGTPDSWVWVTGRDIPYIWGINPATPTVINTQIAGTVLTDEFDGIVQSGSTLWVAAQNTSDTRGLREFTPSLAAQTREIHFMVPVFVYAPSGFTAGGDLAAASPTSQTVIGLQGRALASTAPSNADVVTWNSCTSQWEPAPPASAGTLAGDVTGAIGSNTVVMLQNRTLASTAPSNGQVLTWNNGATRWEPQTPGAGSNPLLLTGVANTTGYIAHVGQLVGLRNINGTLTAVALQQYDMEQWNVGYSGVSPTMTAVDAGITATAGPYALDACALTGALDNYVGASQAVQIAVVYASGTALKILRLDYTGSGWTVNTAASVALTGAPTYISVCSYSTTIAYLAYVDSGTGTGYMLRVDMSTTPPTLGTPAAFNDVGGTIDGVGVYINWNNSGGVMEQGPIVVWGLSGTTAVYTRMSRQSAGVLSFSTPSGVSVNATASAASPHGTFSMWGGGWFLEMTGVMGEGGRWGFNAASNNGIWSGVLYYARGRVPRIDGPDISGTSPSYLIDVAVTGRPGSGCWLDSNLHVGLVWGSKAGYSDGTYAWVVDRRFGDWTARKPVLIGSTAGDLVDSSTYPAPKLRATTCRRITDRSFAFGGFQQNASDSTLCFGVGYVKDGYVHTGYFNHGSYYIYAPAGGGGSFNIADDRQRVVPVKLRDDRFCVICVARPFSSGATPQLYVSPALPIADVHQAVGVAYTTTNPMTVLTYGAVVTTTYSGTAGEWCYGYNPDLNTFSLSYGSGTRPEYESRLGIFISTTQMLIVPTKSG